MKRFIQGEHRGQETFLPASLDNYVTDANPVRVVDIFVDKLDLVNLGFEGALPADTGRPAYHPSVLLKIYIYGYLNRIPSIRHQTPGQPHQLDVALGFSFKTPARWNAVQIALDVNLQQDRGMVSRPACISR